MRRKNRTAQLTYASLMTALAIILSYIPEIPMVFFAPWLKLDFSFTPLLLLGFSVGPAIMMVALLVTNIVHIIVGTTGGVGELANILVGMSFLLPPVIMYQKHRTLKTAVSGMVIGIVLMALMGVLSNRFILLPVYFGPQFSDVMKENGIDSTKYLFFAVVLFNLLKGVLNSLISFSLYKTLSVVFKEAQHDVEISVEKQV